MNKNEAVLKYVQWILNVAIPKAYIVITSRRQETKSSSVSSW